MDPIPAMPVSPAPVADAANNARDAKACDNADPRGFGNQLKQEIATRSGEASEAPAKYAQFILRAIGVKPTRTI